MGRERPQERDVQSRVWRRASQLGSRLFRNNVGLAKFLDRFGKPRKVRYGLCPGSSDLIGWTPVTITPDMIGRTVAVFTAIEVKRDQFEDPKPGQVRFLEAVRRAGGIGIQCHDEEQLDGHLTI